jgi:hypothetical protein
MDLTRRVFFTTMLGAAGAAVILTHTDLLQPFLPVDVPIPIGPAWDHDFDELLRVACEQFDASVRRLGGDVRHMTSEQFKIGQSFLGGPVVTHQFNVSTSFDGHAEHWLSPAIESLAQRCVSTGVDSFARLPVPKGCRGASRGPLRFVVAYSMEWDMLTGRFDVIGGVSPAGQRAASRYKAQATKRSIQKRLGTYRPMPIPA